MPLSRRDRRSLAHETLEIMDRGTYTASNGSTVSIADDLQFSKAGTITITAINVMPKPSEPETFVTEFYLEHTTTIQAIQAWQPRDDTIGVLNFASAKNPGGGFLGGSRAQEESLARSSGLYGAIVGNSMYGDNKRTFTECIYLDQVIYSPRVPFFRDDEGTLLPAPLPAGVVTAPAPNCGAARRHLSEPQLSERVRAGLVKRARLSLEAFWRGGHRTIVLGKWGTGVFRCDPRMVAGVFADLLTGEFSGRFERVVFATMQPDAEFEAGLSGLSMRTRD
eukprot:gnl/Dysnectes_brevis/1997_a2300_1494.p1 GENE.gnl/Dysnectes_brevis/1997_a2300_1494~~gnl/Dysnectes_brevis/1997_a2300_1494.p1  ORF type:complete len:279 (-),score=65.51 gnl/Dysnectes_brevis/1997_a2300_1494:40-876(-)